MIEKDLDKILNYMKQYVENKYEHDSEPMLNWKDLKLVLNEIERLHSIIKEVRELVEQYSWNTYYYQCPSSRRYFKSEIISDLKQILDKAGDEK